MSTRCGIAMQMEDGSIRTIYCHHDGYIAGVDAILGGWYQAPEQIEALLALGDLSSLDTTLETTVAYHRDRGEQLRPNRQYANADEYIAKGMDELDADYIYLYINGEWHVHGLPNDPGFIKINVTIGGQANA